MPKNIIDMTGNRYGKLVVLEMIHQERKKTKCKCQCDCGKIFVSNSYDIRNGHTNSCGCLKNQPSKRIEDLSCFKFGLLKPLKMVQPINKKTMWLCKCDCGNEIVAYASNLKNGHAKSCGCIKYTAKKLSTKRIYTIYRGIISRCFNKSDKNYLKYGAKGITVCDEWKGENGLFNFVDWSYNNGYSEHLSIDRIDVNGNYEPSNCRWVDKYTQANNKRNSVYLTYKGKTQTVPQWSRELGLKPYLIHQRIKLGWTTKQILETRVGEKRV